MKKYDFKIGDLVEIRSPSVDSFNKHKGIIQELRSYTCVLICTYSPEEHLQYRVGDSWGFEYTSIILAEEQIFSNNFEDKLNEA